MTIIFALPRTEYGSYADLLQLISLSEFPTCYYDEIDVSSENTYILTVRNGELENGFPQHRARIVLFDMEWRREPMPPIAGISDYWHIDRWQAELTGMKYVPIGGHAGLRLTDTPTEKQYDVAYLAYMTWRRQVIYGELLQRGVKLTPTSAWGEERDTVLNASKIYGHIHQWDDIPAVPGLRLVVAAAYKLPFVSETCADAGAFRDYVIEWSYGELADNLAGWVGREAKFGALQASGERLHDFLCKELTFRRSIENAL